ncbi:S-layer protein [Paenibacillus pectinilyticus]|uniref:S-layer protein n=1 Tax=Paenibacillus pectinilyticus TaxID=512399 RepID=A0A1C0ZVU9_9BACL|nr:S-layer homology domain-containing protein [Paenibacillus pectinilyticus]OCT12219.1 S-layer protein [Paenibacillus pectinilyticus]
MHIIRFGTFRHLLTRVLVALLLFSALPAGALVAKANTDNVNVVLGPEPVNNGIIPRAGDSAEGLQTGTVAGNTYWQTGKAANGSETYYFYMDVDDSYLHNNTDNNVQMTVQYYDEGNGHIVLQYDAATASFNDAPLFTYTDTKTWKTQTFQLSDAFMGNRTNGADFRIGVEGAGASGATNAPLKLASITVTKTPKVHAADDVAITLGATPVERGITARAGDNESGLLTGELDGKGYWRTNSAAPGDRTLYLYMNVQDAYLYDNSDQDVYVTVEYYDSDNGDLVLQYDALSDSFKSAPLFSYQNTKQWKTRTFKLTDAKFANRANGGDFRIGVSGGGAKADNADLYVASVSVLKVPKPISAPSQAKVINTAYATPDVVIADFNVADFGAVGDGIKDDTRAIQDALDAAGSHGGGVVFAPVGHYKLTGTLLVPTGVTLRGDWESPDSVNGKVNGTVLDAYAGRGDENGTSLIQLQQSSGITHLSIWYPEQSLEQLTAYPWTIEQLTGDNATVSSVTLVNSYNGVKIGPVWNELHYVHDLFGTVLKTGVFLDFTTDIGRIEHVRLSPSYWAQSGLPGAPAQPALFGYMTTHTEGIVMGRSDWEYMSDIGISGFKTGMRITTRTGSLETANAQLYKINITDCNVALKIEGVNDYGLLVTDSTFKANVGADAKAVYATQGFHSIVQFNKVTLASEAASAVVSEGSGVLSFENSSFENWGNQAGGFALAVDSGSIILGQVIFQKPDHHVLMKENVQALNAVNSGYQGELKVENQSALAELNVRKDESYVLETLPEVASLDRAVLPKPATAQLFDVTAAPYAADASGRTDVSAVIQQALTDAGEAGGGTVYLPAGIYRADSRLTVPSGVELRGSWDVPHHTIGGGTVLFTNYGLNQSNGDAFITLEASAGIKGLSVYYDQQNYIDVKPYAWTVQGKGHDVYAINTTLINPYQGIDFGSYDTSGHYIDYVAGSPLKEGIYVGGGSSSGWVRNVQFNPHYYGRNNYPNHPEGNNGDVVWNYQKEHLDAFRIGHATGETIFNTFVYGSQYGIHFVGQNGSGAEAIIIGHGTDGSKKGAFIEQAGPMGLSMMNTELVSLSTSDKVYVTVGPEFTSKLSMFNSSMWGDTTRSFDIDAGDVHIQQSNLTVSGERGVQAMGGNIHLYNSYFQQPHTMHVYTGPEINHMDISNNLFKGGMQMQNNAGSKVTGTNLVPVSLELSRGAFDATHPEQTKTVLTLTNRTSTEPIRGQIELLQPASYGSTVKPIHFGNIALGASLNVEIPYYVGDSLKYKVTLDTGFVYTASLKLGQSFAGRIDADPAVPSMELSGFDQYFSVGGMWKGIDDLSAKSDVQWDDHNVYVTVIASDDHHVQSWSGVDIWQGDSLQLGFDLSRKDGAASKSVSELGFALNNQGQVTKWRWRSPDGKANGALTGVQADITRDEVTKRTTYQIAIPFSELLGTDSTFDPANPIGFTWLLNENDGAGRAGFMEYNQGIGTSKDATLYGDLRLLQGNYTDLLGASAERAVQLALETKDFAQLDGAWNFVTLLPKGSVKEDLLARLAYQPQPSSGAASLPTVTEPVLKVEDDGSVSITGQPSLDSASQTASLSLTQTVLDRALAQAQAGQDGFRRLAIRLSEVEQTKGYAIELPASLFKNNDPKLSITFITPQGSMTVTGAMFDGGQSTSLGERIRLVIRDADRSGWSAALQEGVGARPAVDITVKSDGSPLRWRNSQSPVTVSLPYTPTDAEKLDNERLSIQYVDDQGHTTIISNGKYKVATGEMVFQTNHFSQYAVAYTPIAFADLVNVPWAGHAVEVLAAKGIVQGTSEDEYTPNAPIKRGDFLMMLVHTMGLTGSYSANFRDVQPGSYYEEAIGLSRSLGIAEGSGDNLFNPEQSISRQDAAVFIDRALRLLDTSYGSSSKESLQAFQDVADVAPYAKFSLTAMIEAGLLEGDGSRLHPLDRLTRAESAVIAYRVYQRQP